MKYHMQRLHFKSWSILWCLIKKSTVFSTSQMISWYCKQVVIWHASTDCTQHVKKFPLIVMWNVCICGDYLWTHCTCIQMCFLLCLILLAILECLGNSRNICSVLSSVMHILFDVLSYFCQLLFYSFSNNISLYLLETNLCKDNFSKLCSTLFYLFICQNLFKLLNIYLV